MNGHDMMWLAINAYHEARGECRDGMIAVCHVVINRAEKRKADVKTVIMAPMQFSWANGGARPPICDYDSLAVCMQAVGNCLAERAAGKTLSGADHYFNPSVVLPSWAQKMTRVTAIGNHVFYKS